MLLRPSSRPLALTSTFRDEEVMEVLMAKTIAERGTRINVTAFIYRYTFAFRRKARPRDGAPALPAMCLRTV